MKKLIPILLSLAITIPANAELLRIGGIAITGGGLSLVGTVSTLSLEDNHKSFKYIGWTLIVVGILLDGGDLVIGNANATEIQGQDVWDAVVREASVVSRSPELIKSDMPISNAAAKFGMPAQDIAKIALDIDKATKVAESAGNSVDKSKLAKDLFPNGFKNDVQQRAFENMIALASMR